MAGGHYREVSADRLRFIPLAACASLIAMPFLLPRMRDRFFSGFEVMSIVLACCDPRYVLVAMVAQVDGLLSCMAFTEHVGLGVPVAAVQNAILLAFLVGELRGAEPSTAAPVRLVLAYGVLAGTACLLLPTARSEACIPPSSPNLC